jgi:hypothetical protein
MVHCVCGVWTDRNKLLPLFLYSAWSTWSGVYFWPGHASKAPGKFPKYQFTFLFQFSSTEDKWDWAIIFMVYPSSHSCGFFLQCSIDMKDNVLRVGGGEIAVPFLQGDNLHTFAAAKCSSFSSFWDDWTHDLLPEFCWKCYCIPSFFVCLCHTLHSLQEPGIGCWKSVNSVIVI